MSNSSIRRSLGLANGLVSILGMTALTALGRRAEGERSPVGDESARATQVALVPEPSRRQRRGRLALVGLATATTVLAGGAGTAWAYIHGGSGTGSGSAKGATEGTVTALSPTVTGTLYPGGTASLTVTLSNPDPNVTMTVLGLVSEGTITVNTAGIGTCATTGVSLATPTSITPSTLSAGQSSVQVTFAGALSMSGSSSSGCQGATFNVPVAVSTKVG